jgi:hypothetical protein
MRLLELILSKTCWLFTPQPVVAHHCWGPEPF